MVRNSNIKILAMLMKDSCMLFIKIAKALESMQKKIGLEVALIGIAMKPESYMDVLDKMKEMRYMRSLHASSGDPMLLAECWFENSAKPRNFVKKTKKAERCNTGLSSNLLERIK